MLPGQMRTSVRYLILLIGGAQAIAAVALFVQLPIATQLWPFHGTTSVTFIFVASIFAAAAASQIWAAATENYGAMAGIGLDYLAIFSAVFVISLNIQGADATTRLLFAAVSIASAAFGLALFLWAHRIPIDPQPSQPRVVRGSFVVFVIGLLAVGGLSIAGVPNIVPWQVTPELEALIGWMFVGAAMYFLYSLLRPSWLNSAGQLLGFLAYDVVLIVPFLTRLPTTPNQFVLGLTVYTAVLVYSAVIAIYYLFIHLPTRRSTWRHNGVS